MYKLMYKPDRPEGGSFQPVFGEPLSHVGWRMALALVFDEVEAAREKARAIVAGIRG